MSGVKEAILIIGGSMLVFAIGASMLAVTAVFMSIYGGAC
jgi:hypothetical protein